MPHNTLNQHEIIEEQPYAAAQHLGHVGLAEVVETSEVETKAPYAIFTNPYERMDYMHLTDDLIMTLDGTTESLNAPYDAVVYLDSSARPVSWMVKDMWEFAAHKDEEGNVLPQPQTFFANIDARRTSREISDEDAVRLHDTYPLLAKWNDTDNAAATKNPKRVLIVDEIAVSGDTLTVAANHFNKAFPELTFSGYAWKDERGVGDDRRDNARWYERHNDRLRSVLDPSEMSDKQRAQLAARGVGATKKWLATPNPNRSGAKQLRAEVDRMVQEVQSGEMPYWPSVHRPDEEFEELVLSHNDNLTPIQFRTFREWMKRYWAPSPLQNMIRTDAHGPLTEKEARKSLSERELRAHAPVPDSETVAYLDKFGYRS